ncbi:ATP-binding protein [Candidatus Amarolinea dominans]|uniref:ATP-binding protein n=1 Tax=Candidatus Amarolinea dominans TaxID=3140696 RepID=UPI003137286F|nr:response regulator [Anaerolineae bacterium]
MARPCDVFPAAEAELFTDVCQAVLQTSHATHIEYELPIGDRRVWFEASISPLTDDSTLWVARDVTAHKQAAATLQRQLQALTVLHAVASACIEASDGDDLIIRLTQLVSAALALDEFGIFLLDEAGWLRPHPSYHRCDGSRVQSYRPGQGVVGQTALTGQSHRVADVRLDPDYVAATPTTLSELAVPVKIGERVIAVINAESPQLNSFSADDERLLSTLAGQVATALERLRLWQQTQEQARRVQQIVDTMPEGVLLLDAQERVVLANPTAGRDLATLAGAAVGDIITRLGDLPLTELLLPATRGPWRETSAHDRTFQMIARPIGDTSEPAAWVLVINDVTYERERQRYRQAQERLASVGQMAAGIAHDFNNIMGAIVLYSELLGKAQELTERSKHYLGVIRQQADHAANLIRQILDFSRRAPMERAPLDLLSLTKEMVKLLERTLPESIRLAVKYDQREVIVHGDPTRLQQVLMNLALNARDAMPDGGQLTFSLTTLTLAPGQTPPLPDLGPGRWGCLTVSDSGAGIAPEHLAHIFEPFFTTKGAGQGTGLGLAQVYGIVKQHDGAIDVSSQPGAGAAFTIYLPHVNIPAPTEARGVTVATLPSGTETILLVEDNVATREAIGESLTGLGYRVFSAATGAEALALFDAQGQGIDLVLSDLVMPEMGGLELFRRLRPRPLAPKLLIMTGHAPEGSTYSELCQAGIPWLLKPFTMADLTVKLRAVLDRQPPAGDTRGTQG